MPSSEKGIRVLVAADMRAVGRELARVGVSEAVVRAMSEKGVFRLVHLRGVPAATANLLKQEMLAKGGEAGVSWEAMSGNAELSDVMLMGTEAQLHQLCEALEQYPGELPATGMAILEAVNNVNRRGGELRCGPYRLPLGQKTYIMGIINVTPDSFSGDGLGGDVDAALRQAEGMLADGADIFDVGGESTRPGSAPVSEEEELRRVVPVIRALTARFPTPISIDTVKSAVAREALAAGATIVNDISGLRADPAMAQVAAEAQAPVVVMHMQGTPQTMQQNPHYDDLMGAICAYLEESTAIAVAAGVPRDQVILDPGFGFGKTLEHNVEIVRRLRELTSYGQPVLLGPSRKATIGKLLGGLPPEERVEGTAAAVVLGIANGADIVRVHDVKAIARAAKVADGIIRGFPS